MGKKRNERGQGTIAEVMGDFVANTGIGQIPPETVEFTKSVALKTFAGMVAGSSVGASRAVIEAIREMPTIQEAGVIGCGFRTSTENAILANAHFAHAAELEDDQFPSAASDITVFPVIFPMAERWKLSGEAVVESSALALEVMNRIGMFTLAYRGITDLPFYGVIGAAVVAAKALRLDPPEVGNAIGIAIGRAGGYIANFGTDAHYFESSMASRDGYFAALMAKKGMTGTGNIEGWLTRLHGREDLPLDRIVDGLGGKGRWHAHNLWIKKYPCCFLTHRQIDMMLSMRRKHGLTPEGVASVSVDVGPIDATCDRPNPKHVEDARFSFQHILAGALLEGDVGYANFDERRISDPAYGEIRRKIRVNVRSDWPAEFNSGVAKLTITTGDGRELVEERDQPLGGSNYPLDRKQFLDLYEKYTKGYFTADLIRDTAGIVMDLENQPDLSVLMHTATFGSSK